MTLRRARPYWAGKVSGGIIAPNEISNLETWIDFSDSATITESGGFVSRANDKSGNNRDVIQPTGGNQPELQTGPNGLDVIDTSTGRFMYSENSFELGAYPITIISLARHTNADPGTLQKVPASYSQLEVAQRRIMINCIGDEFGFEVRGSEGFFRALQAGFDPNYNMIEGVAVSSTLRSVSANSGTYTDNTDTVTYPASTHFFIHRSNNQFPVGWQGQSGEHLLYSKVLSETERQGLKAYFEDKWGTLPIVP